jgi:hypothetical protein
MRRLLCILVLLLGARAHAGVVTVNFTATSFNPSSPQGPVSGSVSWAAASEFAPIQSLLSIDLTTSGRGPLVFSAISDGSVRFGVLLQQGAAGTLSR